MITHHVVALGPEFDDLPDDREETVVGTSLHQGAITALFTSLNLCGPRRGLPWFVGNQLRIVAPRQGNKAPYQPYPDILVHPTLTNASRSSLVLAWDGPPALVIEVASPSTALDNDTNLTSPTGKPHVYEAMGVAEYLVFDPAGDILGTQVWARRMGPQEYEPWLQDGSGRWSSAALGIAFAPQGIVLRVYDQDGAPVPITDELADLVDEQTHRVDEQTRRMDEQTRRIAQLEEELRRLRADE